MALSVVIAPSTHQSSPSHSAAHNVIHEVINNVFPNTGQGMVTIQDALRSMWSYAPYFGTVANPSRLAVSEGSDAAPINAPTIPMISISRVSAPTAQGEWGAVLVQIHGAAAGTKQVAGITVQGIQDGAADIEGVGVNLVHQNATGGALPVYAAAAAYTAGGGAVAYSTNVVNNTGANSAYSALKFVGIDLVYGSPGNKYGGVAALMRSGGLLTGQWDGGIYALADALRSFVIDTHLAPVSGMAIHVSQSSATTVSNPVLRVVQNSTGDARIQYEMLAARSWEAGIDHSYGDAFLIANSTGVGDFSAPGSAAGLVLSLSGSVAPLIGSVATNATDGFLYVTSCAGTPTGAPTAIDNASPLVWDRTNKKLYVYDYAGAAWVVMN